MGALDIDCCRACENRHIGCHSTCEVYKYQKEKVDSLRAKIHRDRAIARRADTYTIDKYTNLKKKKVKKILDRINNR